MSPHFIYCGRFIITLHGKKRKYILDCNEYGKPLHKVVVDCIIKFNNNINLF